MKKVLLFILTLLSFSALAQLEVKPDSFKEVPGFVNINTELMEDDNNVLYAVIKVNTENINDKQRHQLLFQGNAATFIELEYKVGEVWVYLSSKPATYIKISHPDFGSTEFWFPYDLQPKKGYEMVLVNKASNATGSGVLKINTIPENGATITLNGKVLSQQTPYTNDMIAAGQYEIIVTKERFKPAAKTVSVNDGENKTVEIEMPIDVANITIKADKQTEIYVDDIFKNKGDWTGELYSGDHIVRYKKEFHNDVEQTITVKAGKAATYTMNPTPILETVKITSEPAGADIFIDGEKYGTTPANLTNVIIGPHRLTLEKKDCASLTKEFTLEKGKQLIISEKLVTGRKYTVTTNNNNDKIFVDGEFVGNSPMTEVISYGEHVITVARDNNLCDDLEVLHTLNQSDFTTKYVKLTPDDKTDSIKIKLVKGAIAYDFSVGDNKKVFFSRGNLQYKADECIWRFAEHQWDIVGGIDEFDGKEYGTVYYNNEKCDNSLISSKYSGWIDLFGYATSRHDGKYPYMTNTAWQDYYHGQYYIQGSAYDWGSSYTALNYEKKKWYTLRLQEWEYVCDKRTTPSGIRYAKATVNNVYGVILLPDNWDASYYNLVRTNEKNAHYDTNIISLENWNNKLEANGAVFLPATGRREETKTVDFKRGRYWSATFYIVSAAHCLYFYDNDLNASWWNFRNYGISVRLVCDSQ